MKYALLVLLLIAPLVYGQNSATTRVASVDTTVGTDWIKFTIPVSGISRSVFSVELENRTAGTLYWCMRSDTANAAVDSVWKYNSRLLCQTTGTPTTFLIENCWTPWIWLKASVSSAVTIRVW